MVGNCTNCRYSGDWDNPDLLFNESCNFFPPDGECWTSLLTILLEQDHLIDDVMDRYQELCEEEGK